MSNNNSENNIRFATTDQIHDCILSANTTSVTPLNNIKDDLPSRITKFIDLSSPTIVLEGLLEEPQWASYFAIAGSNLIPTATIELELFATVGSTTDLLNMGVISNGDLIPLPLWRAGIDPWNTVSRSPEGNTLALWFNAPIKYQRFKLTITHNVPVDPSPPVTTIREQDSVTGIYSAEMESNVAITNVGSNVWTVTADGSASGGNSIVKSGPTFYRNPTTGPRITQLMYATFDGAHDVWIRCKIASSANSFYFVFDGESTNHILGIVGGWQWVKLRTVTLVSQTEHEIVIAARDYGFTIDKVVIQPSSASDPTGTGPAVSSFGVEGSNNSVWFRKLAMGESFQVAYNFSYGNLLSSVTDPKLKKLLTGRNRPYMRQYKMRTIDLLFQQLSKADVIKLTDMEETLLGNSFMMSAFPNGDTWTREKYTMLANKLEKLVFRHVYDDIYETTMRLGEV